MSESEVNTEPATQRVTCLTCGDSLDAVYEREIDPWERAHQRATRHSSYRIRLIHPIEEA